MSSRSGPRSFDPVLLGNRETDAWAAYYRRQWVRFLVAAVGMVRTGFGMGWVKTVIGAFHVLRARTTVGHRTRTTTRTAPGPR